MIFIRIGKVERKLEEAEESWINQEINGRKEAGESVCVRVRFDEGDLSFNIQTPTCSTTFGGGFIPNRHEKAIIELWDERGLNNDDFTGGNVIAFIKQLKKLMQLA